MQHILPWCFISTMSIFSGSNVVAYTKKLINKSNFNNSNMKTIICKNLLTSTCSYSYSPAPNTGVLNEIITNPLMQHIVCAALSVFLFKLTRSPPPLCACVILVISQWDTRSEIFVCICYSHSNPIHVYLIFF